MNFQGLEMPLYRPGQLVNVAVSSVVLDYLFGSLLLPYYPSYFYFF